MRRRWVLAQLCFLLVSTHALGQSDAVMREAYESAAEGLTAFDQGQNEVALDRFSKAYQRLPLPSLAVFVARTQTKLGHFLAACDLYAQAAKLGDGPGYPSVQQRAREEAAAERQALLQRIPKLVIATPGVPRADVLVLVDGQPLAPEAATAGVPLDPGPHKIMAVFAGQQLFQTSALAEGQTTQLTFVFHAAPTKPDSTRTTEPASTGKAMRTAGWVALGMGGLSWTAAGVTALWAAAIKIDIEGRGCWKSSDPACNPADGDRYNSVRRLSTIGFYTGTVGFATGAVLLLAAPKRQSESKQGAHITPWVGIETVGVTGSF